MSQAIKERLALNKAALRSLADKVEVDGMTDEHRASSDTIKDEIRRDEEALALVDEARKETPATATATQEDLRSVATPTAPKIEMRATSPYAKDAGESWFADRAALVNPDASDAQVAEARGRLTAHYESTNDEGGARQIRTYSAGTSSEGGYLVAPQYLQSLFADLLAAGRPAADLCAKLPMPAVGKTFYIPTQSGATAVAVATENNTVQETTATFSQIQLDAARLAGSATLPNWLVDRSFPGADQIALGDLAKQYAVQVDTIVLNSSTSNRKGLIQESNAGAVTVTATTPTIANYWPALLKAINQVVVGVYEYPDAILMHPRRWAYMASLLDTTNRPLIGSIAPMNSIGGFDGENSPKQFAGPMPSGQILGIPIYLDANIPTTLGAGTNEDRIIIMKRSEPILMETTPKFAVSMDAQFAKDQLVARVTGDVAFTANRRPTAVSVLSGTALAAVL